MGFGLKIYIDLFLDTAHAVCEFYVAFFGVKLNGTAKEGAVLGCFGCNDNGAGLTLMIKLGTYGGNVAFMYMSANHDLRLDLFKKGCPTGEGIYFLPM